MFFAFDCRRLVSTFRPLPTRPILRQQLSSSPVPRAFSTRRSVLRRSPSARCLLKLTFLTPPSRTQDPAIVPYAHRVIAQVVPTLARTEAELAQAAAGAAGPPGSAGERTRLFFADGLRGARVELQSKLLK